MGWDCYAYGKLTDEAKADFKRYAEAVALIANAVDGDLERGGLNCSECAGYLHDVLGILAYSETPLSAEALKELAKEPEDWFDNKWCNQSIKNLGLYLSTKAFVDVCVKHGLGIEFSY